MGSGDGGKVGSGGKAMPGWRPRPRAWAASWRGPGLALLLLAPLLQAQPVAPAAPGATAGGVEIRRTTDGIPHLRAANWHDLGLGIGYVQAQDALCTLAEAFITYAGRRAWHFGPAERPQRVSSFGRPTNLELDFFFRAQLDATMVEQHRAQQPAGLNELIEGYAAGYNRYLADARRGRAGAAPRECMHESWVREIAADDIHRRMLAAHLAAGLMRFIPQIVQAQPGGAQAPGQALPGAARHDDSAALRLRLALPLGEQPGLGSNMLAFGRRATGEAGGLLFGNPHWYWGGPERFYQMHLTIPGRVDVAGVGFLGVPLVLIGFNEHVAWSHTVSAARRFGLFDLTLDPADPTRYLLDGRSEPMVPRVVSVDLPGQDGQVQTQTRTLYRTRHGPVVDLGGLHSSLGWGAGHALAVRDVNAENFRVFRTFFHWSQARSLDEFIAIQRREAAIPWANTVAIGRGDGRVWYGDVGAVPHVPDALRAACVTPRGQAFAAVDALTPFLDGSRGACDWVSDPAAAQPGAMPADALPALLREDHVANMNDSYWLTNVHQPLEGFPSMLGGERQALSLRSRQGHQLAGQLAAAPARSAQALAQRLMREVLAPRAWSAHLFKDELLDQACTRAAVVLPAGAGQAVDEPSRRVDIGPACAVLRRWHGRADADARGVLLWEAFWARLQALPAERLYRVPFSSDAPLDTPARAQPGPQLAAEALAGAVVSLRERGVALDAPLGRQRHVDSGGRRWPLYGGCPDAGYFTVVCSYDNEEEANHLGPDAVANSYLQVVYFDARGVVAHTLLAHGQDEAAVSNGPGSEPVARYARKEWLRFPFHEEDIERDPKLRRTWLAR